MARAKLFRILCSHSYSEERGNKSGFGHPVLLLTTFLTSDRTFDLLERATLQYHEGDLRCLFETLNQESEELDFNLV